MVSCLIIGEITTIEVLSLFFEGLPFTLADTATTYEEGVNLITLHKPGIVYIDIELVKQRSVEINLLKHLYCFIVLSANILDYNAFEWLAFDYLIKPFAFHRFRKSLEKYVEFFRLTSEKTLHPTSLDVNYFIIKEDDKSLNDLKIKYTDLLYLEAWGNYVKVHHVNGECDIVRITMKAAEKKLPEGLFSRVHKSYIVNDDKIILIKGEWVHLNDIHRKKIRIGETFKSGFLLKEKIQLIKRRSRGSGVVFNIVRESS